MKSRVVRGGPTPTLQCVLFALGQGQRLSGSSPGGQKNSLWLTPPVLLLFPFHRGRLRLREVKRLAQSHTASEWQAQECEPGQLCTFCSSAQLWTLSVHSSETQTKISWWGLGWSRLGLPSWSSVPAFPARSHCPPLPSVDQARGPECCFQPGFRGAFSPYPASRAFDCSPAPPLPLPGLSPPPPLAAIHPAACPSLWAWPMSGTGLATPPPQDRAGAAFRLCGGAQKATESGHHELPGVS